MNVKHLFRLDGRDAVWEDGVLGRDAIVFSKWIHFERWFKKEEHDYGTNVQLVAW